MNARQTLRKLPVSGDIVFTIGIRNTSLAALEARPEAPAIAPALIAQIEALTQEQLDYKGILRDRDALIARLAKMAVA